MLAFARSLLLVASASLLVGAAAQAQTGIYLPPAPHGPGGEDTIETASGTRCRQSINSSSGYVDIGLAGSTGSGVPDAGRTGNVFISINDRDREALAYARVTVPLGKKPRRIDCSQIYELEIQRLRQEIELLKMNAE
ncbi:MAG TPA: hypothetical protein VM265_04885 [Sphingomicrobium sp.]|nr:hypothetical protein [Sphingomicrobium sp.]